MAMNGSEITKCFHFQVNTLLLRHNFATNNSSVSSRQPPSHCPTDRVHTLLGSGDLLHPGHSAGDLSTDDYRKYGAASNLWERGPRYHKPVGQRPAGSMQFSVRVTSKCSVNKKEITILHDQHEGKDAPCESHWSRAWETQPWVFSSANPSRS